MGFIKPAKKVVFISDSLEEEFNLLPEGWLRKAILKTIDDLKENAFCGEQIKKKLIPKDYIIDYDLDNLWWYPLPNGWRLVYTIISIEDRDILAAIVEYFDHKTYERRFNY